MSDTPSPSAEQPGRDDLEDRLLGIYRIPIKDGLGAVGAGEEPNNPNEFVRRFEASPIQIGAANRIHAQSAAIAELRKDVERLTRERKRAPVQGFKAGIPWDMHLRAYDAYCKKFGAQKALIEGGCRGGFFTDELDYFIPGWRDELSETTKLQSRIEVLEKTLIEICTHLRDAEDLSQKGILFSEDDQWDRVQSTRRHIISQIDGLNITWREDAAQRQLEASRT